MSVVARSVTTRPLIDCPVEKARAIAWLEKALRAEARPARQALLRAELARIRAEGQH